VAVDLNEVTIRRATPDDAAGALAVYAPYVEDTAITFEWEVPSLEEFEGRMARTLDCYPYLVAARSGEVLGFAYIGPFSEREAYAWCAETTVYVRKDMRGCGFGGRLYRALERAAVAQGILGLYACIAYPDGEDDEHLTSASIEFHRHLGYREVGRFERCGYKFGRWYNMAWMEKPLGERSAHPAPVVPFPEVMGGFEVADGLEVAGGLDGIAERRA